MAHGGAFIDKVLYEVCHHARLKFLASPTQEHAGQSSSGRLKSYLSLRGIAQLKEKWDEFRHPRAFHREVSLFVSSSGKHVAVACRNQIVILKKDDDYMQPCGLFVGDDRSVIFTRGAWSEYEDILGVIDVNNSIYLIKSNGEEIGKTIRSQLRLKSPVAGLIVLDDFNLNDARLYSFCILTKDGLLHLVESTSEQGVCLYNVSTPTIQSPIKKQYLDDVSCLDFYPSLSLVVLVISSNVPLTEKKSGLFSLHLLHIKRNLVMEPLYCSPLFEGLFSVSKDYVSTIPPKVIFSPDGKYIATLDLTGHVDVFCLDVELRLVSLVTRIGQEMHLQDDLELCQYKGNIIDVSWWTDDILALAMRTGAVVMYNVHSSSDVSENENGNTFSMPIIERAKNCQGRIFLLGIISASEEHAYENNEVKRVHVNVNVGIANQIDSPGHIWGLTSLAQRSVSEIYANLIHNQNYLDALNFANHHELDSDEVYKAQWIHSSQGHGEVESYLPKIKDLSFVLSECVDKVGLREEDERALLIFGLCKTDHFIFSKADAAEETHDNIIWKYRLIRLRLLQYKDRLETFLGINMGRFAADEYKRFRDLPLTEAAISLAEHGKLGALNLLFKRHSYSLSSEILDILSAVPETVPVQLYSQLLPGPCPPTILDVRDSDWVECNDMVYFIKQLQVCTSTIDTEHIHKLSNDFVWPSIALLCDWYKNRARTIDSVSGQVDNCLSLVDFACRQGIDELKPFFHDIMYLHKLIYSAKASEYFNMSLVSWEQLSNYSKFSMMLEGVSEDMVVDRLLENAIPFMHCLACSKSLNSDTVIEKNLFFLRWLKELATEKKLEICLAVFKSGCRDLSLDCFFKNGAELVEIALECIYLCSSVDQWNVMASILSEVSRTTSGVKLLAVVDFQVDELIKRLKVAEGHIEVGRLFAYYQVPKPLKFFLDAQSDEKNVKQLLRLVLSKFGRRQPSRSDNEWANMWRDMLLFQEKAFLFLDVEHMLIEFIRGLLKAGKFSLARNYLRGTGSTVLATEKAETLVIHAAREYFYSASSLACTEIWKAKECLSLFPSSKVVRAETDMIDALTVRLPNLGVTLLPMQVKQIRNPMEIINMAITSKTGAYLDVEELIQISKLLGLNSPDDIMAVEEAIAREAAVDGDMHLAFDLCFILVNKGHGPIWDLCAAVARGPNLDSMDTISRKKFLTFALSHCDEESVGDLLNAWKDVDILSQYEQLMNLSGSGPPNFSIQGSGINSLPVHHFEDIFHLKESSEAVIPSVNTREKTSSFCVKNAREMLSKVAKDKHTAEAKNWDSLLKENMKFAAFAVLELPWLIKLSGKEEYGKKTVADFGTPAMCFLSVCMEALSATTYWLATNDFVPSDDLISSLAKCVMEPPVTKEEDILGCAFLLNLLDAFNGVEVIEEQMKARPVYEEIYNIMNVGLVYSTLNNSSVRCSIPDQRRKLLLQAFQAKYDSDESGATDLMSQAQSLFWAEWKSKLKEQKQLADRAREVEHLLPGVNAMRFLSGDASYIESSIFSFIDSIKLEKKSILQDAIKLADTYGLHRSEVLSRYLGCALVSDKWGNDDILVEISDFREDMVSCAPKVVDMITSVAYLEIDGHNKQRLSYIYSVLSACYLRLSRTNDPALLSLEGQGHKHTLEMHEFYKVLERECQRLSCINQLNFKNIAGLCDLNFECFNEEICKNIAESTVDVLAHTVSALVNMYATSVQECLLSRLFVFKHYILGILESLEMEAVSGSDSPTSAECESFVQEVEASYNGCKKYIQLLSDSDVSDIILKFLSLCIPSKCSRNVSDVSWKNHLLSLLNFWAVLANDLHESSYIECHSGFTAKSLSRCLMVFRQLVVEGEVSVIQGCNVISAYAKEALSCSLSVDIHHFIKSMILSGCWFSSVVKVYCEAEIGSTSLNLVNKQKDLLTLYGSLTDLILTSLRKDTMNHHGLPCLLSSLSKSNISDVDCFQMIRHDVWDKLRSFSDNMQLESESRVYVLELMQLISGNNLKSVPVELVSEVAPWEEWEQCISELNMAATEHGVVSSGITSNLVSLKSSQLAASAFPDFKIEPEDLLDIDSAISCFLRLSRNAVSLSDIDVLLSILEVWEELFSCKIEKEAGDELPQESDNWNTNNWDEGWEEIPKELSTEGNKRISPSVRPLHACWMEIFKKLVGLSSQQKVIELMDRSLSNSNVSLLDEVEANALLQHLVDIDCCMALRFLLILPYKTPQSRCLIIIENKLKEGSIARLSVSDDDYELLTLVLLSGLMRDIEANPAYCTIFSHLCFLVGHLARLCQEDLLLGSSTTQKGSSFSAVLLPFFIADLIQGGQILLAGYMVSQWMHTPGFGNLDIVDTSLRRYLEGQILHAQSASNVTCGFGRMDPDVSQIHRISRLSERLISQLQAALSVLPDNSNR